MEGDVGTRLSAFYLWPQHPHCLLQTFCSVSSEAGNTTTCSWSQSLSVALPDPTHPYLPHRRAPAWLRYPWLRKGWGRIKFLALGHLTLQSIPGQRCSIDSNPHPSCLPSDKQSLLWAEDNRKTTGYRVGGSWHRPQPRSFLVLWPWTGYRCF